MFVALSLGWGVQSFTLAAMSVLGELPNFPKLDCAVYSDTLHEKSATYAFMEKYTPWLEERGLYVANVNCKDERPDNYINKYGFVSIPAHATADETGGKWVMKRHCTSEWKIAPTRRFLNEERVVEQVELWMGISIDEWERAKDSNVDYIVNRYPLLELDMSREDCVEWLRAHDLDVPPRSACYFCPYTHLEDWKDLAKNHPQDFQRAVAIDEKLRDARPPGKVYLNRFHIPLVDIPDFNYTPKYAQDNDKECDSGFCFT